MEGGNDEIIKPARKRKRYIIAALLAFVIVGLLVGVLLLKQRQTAQEPLAIAQAHVTFPLYGPSSIPTYYFVDENAVQYKNNVIIFQIRRDDGQSIAVSEQALPRGFSLDGINGVAHELKSTGTVVIGQGFLGQRAVIKTAHTLIFLSAPQTIPAGDLQAISYSFTTLD